MNARMPQAQRSSAVAVQRRVVVVGAGIGGLSAAVDLAARGYRVTLVDKLSHVGGKMRRVASGEALIDAGPTVLTLRDVFEDLFAAAGSRLEDHLQLMPLDVLARHAWPDGSRLDLYADAARSRAAIADWAGVREADGFLRFLDHARNIWQTVEQPFVRSPRPTPLSILRTYGPRAVSLLGRIDSRRSLWQALGGFFDDPRLRQLFARYATYSGCSPWSAPATLALIAWVEAAGVWRVEGGIWRVAAALRTLLEAAGGEVVLGRGVAELTTANSRASGVRLDDGTTLPADAVVFAGDVSAIGRGLLGDDVAHAAAPTPPHERSLSALVWCMHAETSGFDLAHHSVFFSDDYHGEFRAIFDHGRLPEQPTVYVCAQDRGDGMAAPQGPERLLLLVNAPPRGDTAHTPDRAALDACEQRTMEHLQRMGLQLTPAAPPHRTCPNGFEQLFPATGGALYGAANHRWNASLTRPTARTRLRGLYLAGGSAHPGAGIPMAALSGRLAAAALSADLP